MFCRTFCTRWECGWSVPRPGHLYPRERTGNYFTGGWVGPKACLDGRKNLSSPGFDPRPCSSLSVALPTELPIGPEGTRKLSFPYFMTTAQDSGKFVSLMHRPPLPQEMLLVLISVDPRAVVRSQGFYVNENFQWHQLGSIQRPSDL